jgi:ABC-2 type transport system permease protein
MALFWIEIRKLFLLFRADPKSVGGGFIAPSLMLVMFYLIFGHLAPFPLAIINQDAGSWGTTLEESMLTQISPLGNIPYFTKHAYTTVEEALSAYEQGHLVGVLVIPSDFSERLERENSPSIDYHLNNANADFAKNLRLYLQEGILHFYRSNYPQVQVTVEEVYDAPVQVEWIVIIASGVWLLAFVIGGMFNVLYLYFKEVQHKTLVEYHLAPRSIVPSFFARISFAFGVSLSTGMLNAALILLLVRVNVFPFFLRLLPVFALTAFTYIFAACLFSLHMRNFYGVVLGAMFGAVLLWFISGGMVHARATGILGLIAGCIPNIYALQVVRGILFDPQQAHYFTNLGILTLFFMVTFLAALWSYRRILWKPISK